MRILSFVQIVALASTISALVGCSTAATSAVAPKPSSPQIHNSVSYFDSCPRTGQIEYVSGGFFDYTIYVFAGNFGGQSPCAQFGSGSPEDLFVKKTTHDLYVAAADSVAIFHRGQTTAYKQLHDPTGQAPYDVTVAADGTVIASNAVNGSSGSLSTWNKSGTFVGNFPIPNAQVAFFITAQKDGTVYFDDSERTGNAYLYRAKCPAGRCGTMTRVAGVTGDSNDLLKGLGSDNQEDILMVRQRPCSGSVADTFELPNPTPKAFPVGGCPEGLALDAQALHLFVAQIGARFGVAAEYSYPAGKLVGTVPFTNPQTEPVGIAVDPPHDL